MKSEKIRWFRFLTLPAGLLGVGFGVAGASLISPELMLTAVILAGISLASLQLRPPHETGPATRTSVRVERSASQGQEAERPIAVGARR